jgi:hypothetical protein
MLLAITLSRAQPVALDVQFKLTDTDYKTAPGQPVRLIFGNATDWQSPQRREGSHSRLYKRDVDRSVGRRVRHVGIHRGLPGRCARAIQQHGASRGDDRPEFRRTGAGWQRVMKPWTISLPQSTRRNALKPVSDPLSAVDLTVRYRTAPHSLSLGSGRKA